MFLVTFTYHAPLAEIDRLLDEHRAHLDSQIAAGTLLLAGRLVPRTGGFLLLHGPTRDQVDRTVHNDPFVRSGAATYEVTELAPTLAQPDLGKLLNLPAAAGRPAA